MDLKFAVLILIGIYSQQLVQAQPTITTPASGDAAATNDINEDNTAATVAETVAGTPSGGNTLDTSASIVSIDGLSVVADYKFEFNNLTLRAKAGATFDYETKTEHVVIFTLADDAPSTATGTLTVSIVDKDEHTPSFAGVEKCGAIAESSQLNAEVGVYPAHDMDGSAAQRVTSYHITGGDDAGSAKFQIDNDGILTRTAVALDAATKSSYPLVIEARGPTNTGTTTISVTVGGSCPGCGAGNGSGNGAGHVKAGVATMFAAFLYLFI